MFVRSNNTTARAWLDSQFNGASRVGLPWHSLLAFLRIVTNPRVSKWLRRWRTLGNKSKNSLTARYLDTRGHGASSGCTRRAFVNVRHTSEPRPGCSSRSGDRAWTDPLLHRRQFRAFQKSSLAKSASCFKSSDAPRFTG